jgi:hypothetical protein
VTEPATGAEAFPYPDDEPGRVRNLATQLQDAGLAVGGAMKRAHGGKGAIADRWVSEAGGRAATEIEAMVGLGGEATAGLGNAWMPLDGYAATLDRARSTIDSLRAQYDQAEADYADTVAAASASGAGRGALHDDALHARSSRRAALRSQYENEMVLVRKAAIMAGQQLGELARRISPVPHAGSPALVRASVLERLPFMAGERGVRVLRTGGLVLVDTGNGHDDVRISQDPGTGQVTIVINGVAHRFSAAEAGKIVVRTQGGSDVIEVAPEVRLGFTVLGGDDRDLVAGGAGGDVLLGGHGRDTVVGGGANDVMAGGSDTDHLSDDLGLVGAAALPSVFGGRTVRARAGSGADIIAGDNHDFELPGNDVIDAGTGDDIVHGGSGNDVVRSGAGRDMVDAGFGDDRIHAGEGDDYVTGNMGNDYIDGHRGDDTIDGGSGQDVIYAGEGDDIVAGGSGRDYIDGYRGDDTLDGGDQNDIVSGGAGDDTLTGDLGDDVIYAGAGRDAVTDQDGRNHVYRESHDTVDMTPQSVAVTVEIAQVPANIHVQGSTEFQDRVRADLETLASSPTGQKMLQAIGEQGNGFLWTDGARITIVEHDGGGFARGVGDDRYVVGYQVDRLWEGDAGGPPIDILPHELAHAYNGITGTEVGGDADDVRPPVPDSDLRPLPGEFHWYLGPDAHHAPPGVDANRDGRVTFDEVDRDDDGDIDGTDLDLNGDGRVTRGYGSTATTKDQDGWLPNYERQATGEGVDHDGNPDTPDIPASQVVDHPDALTTNALRKEMGLPPVGTELPD